MLFSPVVGYSMHVSRRTDVDGKALPPTPPKPSLCAIAGRPRAAVSRVVCIRIVDAVFCPLRDVAMHVVETPWVGLKAVHRHGLVPTLSLAGVAGTKVGLRGCVF